MKHENGLFLSIFYFNTMHLSYFNIFNFIIENAFSYYLSYYLFLKIFWFEHWFWNIKLIIKFAFLLL